MSWLSFAGLPPWAMLLSLLAHLAAGIALGIALFPRPVAECPPFRRRRARGDDHRPDDRPLRPAGRSAGAGEPGRRAAAARDGAGRLHRPLRGHAPGPAGRAMNSPLASVALFHLGPVPITAGVVDHLGDHGGAGPRRHPCHPPPVARPLGEPGRPRAGRRHRGRPDPRHDAGRAGALSRLHRHAVRLHLRRQLVVAGPRRRAADGPSRDRRRAGAPRLPRRDLVRHPRRRHPRLSREPSPRPTRS